MDRREEETEDGERRRIQSDFGKYFELFPLDLTPDIILRLPAKTAVRFRGVSKLWSSITTRPDFIRSFATQSSTRPCLLVSFITKDKRRCFISLSQHERPDPDTCCSHVDRFQIQSPEVDYSPPTSPSVHGLICFVNHGYVVVWNPTMRQRVLLPDPGVRFKSCFLGYDPVEDKHKVLCISGHRYRHDPQVLTLGPQESWRVTQNSPLHFLAPSHGRVGLCINGHVYYKARMDDTFQDGKPIMSFDVRYENFNAIRLPAANPNTRGFLLNYQGKLAWFRDHGVTSLRFWVLEDKEKQEWSFKNFLFSFPVFPLSDPSWDVKLRLKGVTHG